MALIFPGIPLRHVTVLVVTILLLCIALPASSREQAPDSPIMVPNPGSDLWRAVRQREAPGVGVTQARGVETGVLIQRSGETFREFRRDDLISGSATVIGVVAAAILVFFLFRGRMRIADGRSGKVIERFRTFDRWVHWFLTILFIVLALTGLNLLFGRFTLLPLVGAETFGAIAAATKLIHDYVSPLFLVAVILMFVRFAAKNIPRGVDFKWLLRGGGMIGKGHASAGFFNAGEKIWFWVVIGLGTIVSASGLFLLFPIFGQGREIMQLALIIHGVASVLFIAGSFGHIYMGTIGTEGSLEGMVTGYVDANWVKTHHDLWYEEVRGNAIPAAETAAQETRGRPPAEGLQITPDKA